MDKITAKLIEMHIMALYDFMCPVDYHKDVFSPVYQEVRREKARFIYKTDIVFNSRVNSLVAMTLKIVKKTANPLQEAERDNG